MNVLLTQMFYKEICLNLVHHFQLTQLFNNNKMITKSVQRGKEKFNLLLKMLKLNKIKENPAKILKQVTVLMKTNRFRKRQTIHNKNNF